MVSLADTSNPPQLGMSQCTRVQAGDNTPQSVRSRVHLMLPDSAYQQYLDCRSTNDDGTFDEELLLKRTEAVKGGRASYAGYCVFEDGTEPSLAAAPLYFDASVPPILGAYVTGWVPTINWTVQFKGHPKPGPLKFQFDTSTVNGGFLEEDGRLWDSEGTLIYNVKAISNGWCKAKAIKIGPATSKMYLQKNRLLQIQLEIYEIRYKYFCKKKKKIISLLNFVLSYINF